MEGTSLEKVKILGEGTYGKCYLVLDKTTNQLCVLKQIEIMGMTQEETEEAVKEARILESLSHPCIVQFLSSYQSKDGHLNILMSYADGGDLSQKIKEVRARQEVIPESQIVHWLAQVCLAIQHVHERKIIHRDIKTQNIFLTKEGDVKLGDFGIARPLQLTLQKIRSVVGTPYYMSPEICENKEYSFKTDIWSLGVILLEMCLLRQPYDANSLPALALKIAKGDYTPVPKLYSKELKRLVAEMMQVDPVRRPSIIEVLNSPLLRDQPGCMRFKDRSESDASLLQELSLGRKKRSGPCKGLHLDCQSDEHSPIEYVVSPKSQQGLSKHYEMPVRRVDNYTKEACGKKPQKQGAQLRRREGSEPSLTPKGHGKIDNERKVMVKNSSQVNLQKKKPSQGGCFKKKPKCREDIVKSLEEIREFKNDIYSMQGQISHRDKPTPTLGLDEHSSHHEEPDCPQETLLETLQAVMWETVGEFEGWERECEGRQRECVREEGVCGAGPGAGLATLAWGLRKWG